jgi:ABC-type nitrate/sulfonate/bicarbonate transport system substrate-binding protein
MTSVRWLVLCSAMAVLASGCGAAATPAASGSAPPSASAQAAPKPAGARKFVLGHSQITGNALSSWAAEDGEYFKKNGLDVDAQLMSGGTKTVAALLAGQIQIAEVGGSEVIGVSAEGADLVITAVISPVYPYKMEVAAGHQDASRPQG